VPQRKRYVFVCVNRRPETSPRGSCGARGSEAIHARLKALLRQRGLADAEVRACSSSCLDTCWAGPSICIEPDHVFYGRVTMDDLDEIADALERGGRVDRLLLGAEDFEMPERLRNVDR
jgi:(2Fe-2S) ferredoxin